MDDLNRLAQLIAARDEGDLSEYGAELLAQLMLKHPDEAAAWAAAPRLPQ